MRASLRYWRASCSSGSARIRCDPFATVDTSFLSKLLCGFVPDLHPFDSLIVSLGIVQIMLDI